MSENTPQQVDASIPISEAFIVFEGVIDQQATTRIFEAIATFTAQGFAKITIFFSSLGGSIYEGFLLATIIQNSKTQIAIHATNHIDSIANVIFLSAKERSAESHAKFYLHGASTNGNFDEKGLKEKLSEIRTHNSRIAYFVSENTTIPLKRVQIMMRAGTTISAQDALSKYGMVQEIKHREIPVRAVRNEIIYVN